MARKQHLSKLAAPKTWPILRKTSKWVTKCNPGPHAIEKSLPAVIVLRDLLKIARSMKEVKYILNEDAFLINQIPCKDKKFPIGLFDVISIPKLNKSYRMVFDKKGKLSLIDINEADSTKIVRKVKDKKIIKKNKTQINFDNGWNVLVENNTKIKPNDSVIIDLKTKKITKHLKLEKEKVVVVVGGSHVGSMAVIKEITDRGNKNKRIVVLTPLKGDENWETTLNNLVVVGDKESEVMLFKE